MSLRGKSLKGSALLSAGEAVIYGASFVRNMILARLLTKADFGTAAAFAMVITLLEFTNKLGISRFVIRDKEGAQADFIATAHLMQFVTGVISALLIAVAAVPLANLFGLENHRWTMVVLAVVPVLNGLQHLDVRRFERDLRFGPSTLTEVIPQIVITLAAWPLAHWLGDFRAMLVLLIGKSVMSCVSSHWLAEQPYRWQSHRDYSIRMLKFGWPLLVTGFLMFGTLQGDQFLVATFYTMTDLGPYAAAAALTMAPSFVFGRIFNSVMLPVMAKVQDDPVAFHRRYRQATAVIVTFAAVCAAGMIIGSEALMVLVYGPKYAGAGVIMAWLAASNAYRNLRISPALAAMAKGDSQNQMISNLWRVVALVPALVLALAHYPVWMLACTGVVGELLACRAAWVRLSRRDGVPLSTNLVSGMWVAGAIIFAFGIDALGVNHWNPYLAVGIAAFCSLCIGAGMVMMMPVLRHEAAILWSRWRQTGFRRLVQRV
ncbi:MAG TPA: oligosaccharide flippase family protein [Verrucomicrobiales bacterium]|nr:oligosaccharide flippase family protein [Verrucomicrobiales bacterium]